MIVDRFKEVEKHIQEKHRPVINTRDPLYPFFKVVCDTTRMMWSFDELIEKYRKKITLFFAILNEEKRIKELQRIVKLQKQVKEKMHEIKSHLFEIEKKFLMKKKSELNIPGKKISKKDAKIAKMKELQNIEKNIHQSTGTREGEDMNNLYDIQHRFIVNTFLHKCEYFFRLELEFKNKKENEVIRKMKIFSDNVDEEELRGMILKGCDFQQLSTFYKRPNFVIAKSTTRTIKLELEAVQETRQDLLDLETQMNELLDMFQDMFVLTNMMDEPINNIEYMVEKCNIHVQKARKAIKSARKMQLTHHLCHRPKCIIQ